MQHELGYKEQGHRNRPLAILHLVIFFGVIFLESDVISRGVQVDTWIQLYAGKFDPLACMNSLIVGQVMNEGQSGVVHLCSLFVQGKLPCRGSDYIILGTICIGVLR